MKNVDMYRKTTRENLAKEIEKSRSWAESQLTIEGLTDSQKASFTELVKASNGEHLRKRGLAYMAEINKRIATVEEVEYPETIEELTSTMNGFFSALNTLTLYEALDAYAEMGYEEATAAYMQDQTVKSKKASYSDKEKVWKEAEATLYLRPYDFFRTVLGGAELPHVVDGAKIIRDNFLNYFQVIVCKKEKDEETSATAKFSRAELSKDYIKLRDQHGRTDWKSKKKLRAQLTTYWKWMLGKAAPKTANSADVGVMLQAVATVKDRANTSAALREADNATCVDLLFRTAWTNYNEKPYEIESAKDRGESPESIKANKDMAETPTKPDPKTEVTKTPDAEESQPEKKPAAEKKPEPAKAEEQPKK